MDLADLSLKVDSPIVDPDEANFRPGSWPPADDFPIVVDAEGKVLSRYCDSVWDFTPWVGSSLKINFGDGAKRHAQCPPISPENAALFRQIIFWWMYGERGVLAAKTYALRFSCLRPLFVLCTKHGVLASQLVRFPIVADQLSSTLTPSMGATALGLLHRLFEMRDQFGFVLLDREGLRRLEAALPEHEGKQTPYIPPRIWTYQVSRLRAYLDQYLSHRDGIEECFKFCLDAYAKNFGSPALSFAPDRNNGMNPFSMTADERRSVQYFGPFLDTAKRFGIDELLQRWCVPHDNQPSDRGFDIRTFSKYLTSVSEAGVRYLINFSLMRIEEAWTLRADCLDVEHDEQFGDIYLLRGPTTKTIDDDDARWVTSPSAVVAVAAMTSVARLRMIAAEANPNWPTKTEDIRNPYLINYAHEPWVGAELGATPAARPNSRSYGTWLASMTNLLDAEQMRITEDDLRIARLITPSLDNDTFAVGNVWPIANHQLRRTGAVNMQASGLVSDASLQYQLKHATRAMSLYYGQGYSRVRLNAKAQTHYLRTMYEVIGKEIAQLFSPRFVSPLGEDHKLNVLRLIDPKDSKLLQANAKLGRVAYRETLLGGCTKRGPCAYGGIDNIARCAGGDGSAPCHEAVFDREKTSTIQKLGRLIASRLVDAPEESPLRASLEAQQRSVENALDVLSS